MWNGSDLACASGNFPVHNAALIVEDLAGRLVLKGE